MLSFIFAFALTIAWGLFALGALCVASADEPEQPDLDDHDRSMTGD